MTHLREVVSMGNSDRHYKIGQVRAFASQVESRLEELLEITHKQRKGVAAAKTVEKVAFRYARWVGWYRSADGTLPILLRCLERPPIHLGLVDDLVECKRSIDQIAASPHPWLSLPHHENTKFNALRLLDEAIGHFEAALLKLKQLQGHLPVARDGLQ